VPQAPQQPAQQVQQPSLQHTGPQNTAPQQPQPQPQAQPQAQPVNTDAETYFRLENKNNEGQVSSIIEIDLISYRERGVESRYISINTLGRNQENQQSDTTIAIDNEEDFIRFKKFVSQLNWND
jgi:hypothetical protein